MFESAKELFEKTSEVREVILSVVDDASNGQKMSVISMVAAKVANFIKDDLDDDAEAEVREAIDTLANLTGSCVTACAKIMATASSSSLRTAHHEGGSEALAKALAAEIDKVKEAASMSEQVSEKLDGFNNLLILATCGFMLNLYIQHFADNGVYEDIIKDLDTPVCQFSALVFSIADRISGGKLKQDAEAEVKKLEDSDPSFVSHCDQMEARVRDALGI